MNRPSWPHAGLWLAGTLLLALVVVDAAAVWGIVDARRQARQAAQHDLDLRTAALARSLEASLAALRADLVFLSRSPPLLRFRSALDDPDPLVRRWGRLDLESTLVLFAEAHPAVEWLLLCDAGGTPWLHVGRQQGVPVLLPPESAPQPERRAAARRFALPPLDAELLVSLDPEALLRHSQGLDRLDPKDELSLLLRPPPDPATAGAIDTTGSRQQLGQSLVRGPEWTPPIHWQLVRREPGSELARSVESLAGRYRTTVVVNVAVLSLSLLLGTFTIAGLRRVARLEAERRHERQIRELEQQLAHSQRLASIGRLAAGFAHEINNPLEGMSNYLALAREDIDAGRVADGRELLGRVEEGIVRVAGVIRQILTYSEPNASQRESLDLRRVLEEALDFVRSDPRHRDLELRLDAGTDPLPLEGNGVTLGQLFLNLLLNACQARPAGGPIEVRAQHCVEGVRITVEDRGPGLPADVLDTLFEPFVSTRGSTGLGLAVCHGIVRDHGGRIEAHNREGGGACIAVTLPSVAAVPISPGGAS